MNAALASSRVRAGVGLASVGLFLFAEFLRFKNPGLATLMSMGGWATLVVIVDSLLPWTFRIAEAGRFLGLVFLSALIQGSYYWHSLIVEAGSHVDTVYTYEGLRWFLSLKNPITFMGNTYSYSQMPMQFFIHLPSYFIGFDRLGSASFHFGAIVQVSFLLAGLSFSMGSVGWVDRLVAVALASCMFCNRFLLQAYNLYSYAIPAFLLSGFFVFLLSSNSSSRRWAILPYLASTAMLYHYAGLILWLPLVLWGVVHCWRLKGKEAGELCAIFALILGVFLATVIVHPQSFLARVNDVSVGHDTSSYATSLGTKIRTQWDGLAGGYLRGELTRWLRFNSGSWIFLNVPLLGRKFACVLGASVLLGLLLGRGGVWKRAGWFGVYVAYLFVAVGGLLLVTDFQDYRFSIAGFAIVFLIVLPAYRASAQERKWKVAVYMCCAGVALFNWRDITSLWGSTHSTPDYGTRSQASLETLRREWPSDQRLSAPHRLAIVTDSFFPMQNMYEENILKRIGVRPSWIKAEEFCKDPGGTVERQSALSSGALTLVLNLAFCDPNREPGFRWQAYPLSRSQHIVYYKIGS